MDIMPKRRKKWDNPYVLSKDEENDVYFVSFKDGLNVYRSIRISKEIYQAFNEFELRDLSEMNEFDRHIERLPVDISAMTAKVSTKENFEDEMISNIEEQLIEKEIWKLPAPQNRRVYKYLIEEMTQREIAEIEQCNHTAISRSIGVGIKKLRKKLKNF